MKEIFVITFVAYITTITHAVSIEVQLLIEVRMDCNSPIDYASCPDLLEPVYKKWAWDPYSEECMEFLRGECGGNYNAYSSKEICEKACYPKKEEDYDDEEDFQETPRSRLVDTAKQVNQNSAEIFFLAKDSQTPRSELEKPNNNDVFTRMLLKPVWYWSKIQKTRPGRGFWKYQANNKPILELKERSRFNGPPLKGKNNTHKRPLDHQNLRVDAKHMKNAGYIKYADKNKRNKTKDKESSNPVNCFPIPCWLKKYRSKKSPSMHLKSMLDDYRFKPAAYLKHTADHLNYADRLSQSIRLHDADHSKQLKHKLVDRENNSGSLGINYPKWTLSENSIDLADKLKLFYRTPKKNFNQLHLHNIMPTEKISQLRNKRIENVFVNPDKILLFKEFDKVTQDETSNLFTGKRGFRNQIPHNEKVLLNSKFKSNRDTNTKYLSLHFLMDNNVDTSTRKYKNTRSSSRNLDTERAIKSQKKSQNVKKASTVETKNQKTKSRWFTSLQNMEKPVKKRKEKKVIPKPHIALHRLPVYYPSKDSRRPRTKRTSNDIL